VPGTPGSVPGARYPAFGVGSTPVPGTRHLGPDTWYRIDAEGRTPSTEDRGRPLENAHTEF